jgi:hypothetical protein
MEGHMNKLLKKTLLIAIVITIVISVSASVAAHSIFYSPSWTGYYLSWYYRTGTNQAYIKVNQDYLDETDYLYQSYVDTARSRWNNASSRVYAIHASFSISNVDYATPTETYWINSVGESHKYEVIAFTQWVNLDGVYLNHNNIASANRSVKYSAIYVSPYDSTWDGYSETRRKAILAHEMGHVFCLGHPDAPYYPENIYNNDDSIMEFYAEDMALYPTTHDIVDLQYKYYE